MRMWPISTRIDKPENDAPSILDPIELVMDAASVAARRHPQVPHPAAAVGRLSV
jgi:hypothetical protein